jgi:RNA polymerase sigma-70 factor (ECF subfamily)
VATTGFAVAPARREYAVERPRLPFASGAATITAVDADFSDGELIARIATQDRGAFDELYGRYARAVLGLALRRIGDRGRAEDATQETFAAVWRSASKYDSLRGPGAPWLYTVARNTVIDMLRRSPEIAVADGPDQASGEQGPADETEQAWTAWRVHRAVAELPDHEREAVELAYWGGLSQSEVASFLGVPLGTVKTRTRSGLARLADALEGELR